MSKITKSLFAFAFLATLMVAGGRAFAIPVTTTFTGNGDGTTWNDSSNWDNGKPSAGKAVVFDNETISGSVISTNDIGPLSLASLTFQGADTTHHVEIAGPALTIAGGGISDNTTGNTAELIDSELMLSADQSFASTGSLNIGGTVHIADHVLSLSTSGSGLIAFEGSVRNTTGSVIVRGTGLGVGLDSATVIKSYVDEKSGKLWGSAAIGRLDVHPDGWVSPGAGVGAEPGCMTIGKTFIAGTYEATLKGASACSSYDRLKINGKVQLNGSMNLNVSGFTPVRGSAYVLIANDGTDPIIGHFADKKEGKTFSAGGSTWKITYMGGAGRNDLVVTRQ